MIGIIQRLTKLSKDKYNVLNIDSPVAGGFIVIHSKRRNIAGI